MECIMSYKSFLVRFHSVQELSGLKKPIEIYMQFIDAIGNTHISGSNFNKYSSQQQPYNPRIEVRLNLVSDENQRVVEEALQKVHRTLVESNTILEGDIHFENWIEPNFVVKAHETATLCAVAFKERLDTETSTHTSLMDDQDDFMWKFMISLLRKSGFSPNIIWGFLRTPISEEIQNLASVCSQILVSSFNSHRPTADFIERFIHCLFNCTLSAETVKLLPYLMTSNIWQNLIDGWQSPR